MQFNARLRPFLIYNNNVQCCHFLFSARSGLHHHLLRLPTWVNRTRDVLPFNPMVDWVSRKKSALCMSTLLKTLPDIGTSPTSLEKMVSWHTIEQITWNNNQHHFYFSLFYFFVCSNFYVKRSMPRDVHHPGFKFISRCLWIGS